MDFRGTFQAAIQKIVMKADTKNDGQQLEVEATIRVDAEQAEKMGDFDLRQICFGDMHETVEESEVEDGEEDSGDATVTRFGYGTKKPPKWARPSVHKVSLWGTKQETQPQLLSIASDPDSEEAILKFRFVLDTNEDAELIGNVGVKCGKTAKVTMKPLQQAVPFVRKTDGEVIEMPTKKEPKKKAANA